MMLKFAGQCPPEKRGRPLSSRNLADLEKQGIDVCEKTRKRDGVKIYYKTGEQKQKEKKEAGSKRELRKKAGVNLRGRLSKISKEKIEEVRGKLAEIAEILGKIKPAEKEAKEAKTKKSKKAKKMDGVKEEKQMSELEREVRKHVESTASKRDTPEILEARVQKLLGEEKARTKGKQKEKLKEEPKGKSDAGRQLSVSEINQNVQEFEKEITPFVLNSISDKPSAPATWISDIHNNLKNQGIMISPRHLNDVLLKLNKEKKISFPREETSFNETKRPESHIISPYGTYTILGRVNLQVSKPPISAKNIEETRNKIERVNHQIEKEIIPLIGKQPENISDIVKKLEKKGYKLSPGHVSDMLSNLKKVGKIKLHEDISPIQDLPDRSYLIFDKKDDSENVIYDRVSL